MGILTAIKKILRAILFPSIYTGGIFVTFYSIFKDAKWGLYLLVILSPQPNIWHKFFSLPMGKDFLDILFLAVVIGVFVQNKKFTGGSSTSIIVLFLLYTYLSLWNSSFQFDLPFPLSQSSEQLMEWKNFAQMIFFYFLVMAIVKDEDQQKILFILMTAVILFMAIRNYRNFSGGSSFSYDKRVGGPFEAVMLGATHYGAFVAHFMVAFLGMSFFERDKKKKILYLSTFSLCLHPLFYSYSRGAYVAVVLVLIFFGVMKKPAILFGLLFVVIAWQSILPPSVVDRIAGSRTETGELESSANTRFELWEQAGAIIAENFLFGVGWEGFGLSVKRSNSSIHGLTDTHNYYVKTLCDRGIIGLVLLLLVFGKAFFCGFRLFRSATSEFQKGLGFCFMGTVLACMATNLFGDRFTYYVLGSYFWILWGLVEKGLVVTRTEATG